MKNSKLKTLFLLLIAIGVIYSAFKYVFFRSDTQKSTKAAGETVTLSFVPSSSDLAIDAEKTIIVKVKPSVEMIVRGYLFNINFDKSKLEIKDVSYKIGTTSAGLGQDTDNLATINNTGVIKVWGQVNTAIGRTLTTTEANILTFRVKSKSTEPSNIRINKTSIRFARIMTGMNLASIVGATDAIFQVNGGIPTATPSPTGVASSCTDFSDNFSGTSLDSESWIIPENSPGTVLVGDIGLKITIPATNTNEDKKSSVYYKKKVTGNFETEVTLKSVISNNDQEQAISELAFVKNTTNLEKGFFIDRFSNNNKIKTASVLNGEFVNEEVEKEITNTTPLKVKIKRDGDLVDVYYDLNNGEGYQLIKSFNNEFTEDGYIMLTTINVKDNSQVSAVFDDFILTCLETENPTPTIDPNEPTLTPDPNEPTPTEEVNVTPSPTPVGGIDANVTFKLKFQGISSKPKDDLNQMSVRLRLYDENTEKYADVDVDNFTANDNGIWTADTTFTGVLPNHKYALLVKGKYHLQKKICNENPTETSPGTYRCIRGNISLTENNELDLSKVILLAGDLPVQDGVVNAYDTSLIRNNLGKNTPEADVNRDGIVDTQDWSLVIAALSIRSDDL